MILEKKLQIVLKNAEEVIKEEEIKTILEEKQNPKAYIGFELSGFLHLGTGLICGNKFKDLARAGFETIVFLADWHSWINNKLGADMEKIQIAGEYFKKAFETVGVKGPNIRYRWASELVEKSEYWAKVIRIAKASTLSRIKRVLPIMGRKAEGELETAFLFYPAMQVADIFEMELDLAVGGMDQRKAHMLARDVAEKLGMKKPACLHTPLLTGLAGAGSKMDAEVVPDLATRIEEKMSKSKPDTCIFIHDSEEEIKRKIKKAHCPAKITNRNPIIEIVRYIIFDIYDNFTVVRPEKFGGDIVFRSYTEFEQKYLYGSIHPLDLKNAVSSSLIEILKQPRKYFEKHDDIIQEISNLMQ
ncbi:MAG: tyrosine--tRNA ligase [Candidatus Heimdallarchaeaceae archaeon]